MSHKPQQILRDVWSWLPAFREVGRCGGVAAAAEVLHLSPSAVSRAITSLEESLGVALFYRENRRMILSPEGQALLLATDHATQELSLAVTSVTGGHLERAIAIGSMGDLIGLLAVPACTRVRSKHGSNLALRFHAEMTPSAGLAALREGRVDLYLGMNMSTDASIHATRVGAVEMVMVVGRGHPCFDQQNLTAEELLAHPFAARPPYEGCMPVWPNHVPRTVGLGVDSHALGKHGDVLRDYVVVMEARAARTHPTPDSIRVVTAPFLSPAELKAFCRAERAKEPILEEVIAALRAELATWDAG